MKTNLKNTWFKSFKDLTREYLSETLKTEGTIPTDLNGILYRVGVGSYQAFGKRHPHWFDGDGAILSLEVNHGKVTASAKQIVSPGTLEELKVGKQYLASYGISAGNLSSRLSGKFRNPGNTNIISWNRRIFALWEGGLPIEISPSDLTTIGETDLGGLIPQAFSAHPRHVPSRNALYNFGVRYGARSKIDFFELRDDGTTSLLTSLPFSMRTIVHDLIATENHLIVVAPPVFCDPVSMLLKGKSLSKSLTWKPSLGTEIIVVPIDQPHKAWRIHTATFLPLHFFNAFEKQGKLVFDGVCYPDLSGLQRVDAMSKGILTPAFPAQITRKIIDLESKEVDTETLFNDFCEFPQVSPHFSGVEHQFGYSVGYKSPLSVADDFFDSLAKLNFANKSIEKIHFGPGQYPSEPLFVPKKQGSREDDGYLLSVVYDSISDTNYLAIIDASHFSQGVIGKAYLSANFPLTFHGSWVDKS